MLFPYLRDQSDLKVRTVIDGKMTCIIEFKNKCTDKLMGINFFLITPQICTKWVLS